MQDCRLRIEERRALVVIVLSLGQLELPMSSWGESAGDGGLVALVVLLLVMSPLQPCPGSDSHPWCCCYWFNSCVPAVSRFCCCVLVGLDLTILLTCLDFLVRTAACSISACDY